MLSLIKMTSICGVFFAGSAGRREEETADESLFYNTKVNPLVEEMGTHVKGIF